MTSLVLGLLQSYDDVSITACKFHFGFAIVDSQSAETQQPSGVDTNTQRLLHILKNLSLCREHLKGKYHCMVDLLIDRFRNVHLYNTKISFTCTSYISKLVKQKVNLTVILSLWVFPGLCIIMYVLNVVICSTIGPAIL